MPIWEPGLEALVKANVERGRLSFTTDLAEAVEGAQAVFIAVGTPGAARRRPCRPHLRVRGGARACAPYRAGHGGGHQVDRPGRHRRRDRADPGRGGRRPGVSVASNPEFLREGAAIADFKHPDRIVVGAEDEHARELMKEIYRPLFLNRAPILFTERRTAELIKYAANAFLAVKISFINEIADLCEAVDADVQDVARGIGLDNRIGPKFLHAGPGYGGSCFPKDTLALLQTAQEAGVEQRIVATTVAVNDERKAAMAERVERALGGIASRQEDRRARPRLQAQHRRHARCAVDCADQRAARARGERHGLRPGRARAGGKDDRRHIASRDDAEAAAKGADALVIVTEWDEFRALDLSALAALMRGKTLVDLRNVYEKTEAERAGLRYLGVGRGRLAG